MKCPYVQSQGKAASKDVTATGTAKENTAKKATAGKAAAGKAAPAKNGTAEVRSLQIKDSGFLCMSCSCITTAGSLVKAWYIHSSAELVPSLKILSALSLYGDYTESTSGAIVRRVSQGRSVLLQTPLARLLLPRRLPSSMVQVCKDDACCFTPTLKSSNEASSIYNRILGPCSTRWESAYYVL